MPRADNLPNITVGTEITLCTHNPLGVKGCGEVGAIGSPPAIINAMIDALKDYGVRHINMPATRAENLVDHPGRSAANGGGIERGTAAMYDFAYQKPASLADAVKALGADADAKALAGGMTLIPVLKQRLNKPSRGGRSGEARAGRHHRSAGNTVTIGAMTTHGAVANSAEVKAKIPALADLAAHIGDDAVRHRGTIGGSLANNDPAADYPAAALALGATIKTDRALDQGR